MRIRVARPTDHRAIEAVYQARAAVSTGPMVRTRAYWTARWRRTGRSRRKHIDLVAVKHGRVVGHGGAILEDIGVWIEPPLWLPEMDGTGIGARLVAEALRRSRRWHAAMNGTWVVSGAPTEPIFRGVYPPPRPPSTLFMAAVLDERALLRDASRVVATRVSESVRLRVGRHQTATRRGSPKVTVSCSGRVLLGLLLGLRDLDRERRAGRTRISPHGKAALDLARRAFPPRKFWIQDAW